MSYSKSLYVNKRFDDQWSPSLWTPLPCLVTPTKSLFEHGDLRDSPNFVKIVDWLIGTEINWKWSACKDTSSDFFDITILSVFLFEKPQDAMLCRLSCSDLTSIERYGINNLDKWYL